MLSKTLIQLSADGWGCAPSLVYWLEATQGFMVGLTFPGGSEPVMTWVRSLSQEGTLENEMTTHSGIPAWKIPWMEKSGRLYSVWGRKVSDMTKQLHFLFNGELQEGLHHMRPFQTGAFISVVSPC